MSKRRNFDFLDTLVTLIGILLVAFIFLKLASLMIGFILFSWVWVLSPLWIPMAILGIMAIIDL